MSGHRDRARLLEWWCSVVVASRSAYDRAAPKPLETSGPVSPVQGEESEKQPLSSPPSSLELLCRELHCPVPVSQLLGELP